MVAISNFIPPITPPVIERESKPYHGGSFVVVKSHGYEYMLTGNTLLPSERLKKILEESSNPRDATEGIEAAYRRAGYFLVAVKSVLIKKTIHIEVVQGQITKKNITGELGGFFSGVERRSDIMGNDIIYDSVLANAFAQRNGKRMQIGFDPAENPGGSELNVTQSPLPGYSPFSGSVTFGNYGSRYTSGYLAGENFSYTPGLGLDFYANSSQGIPTISKSSQGSQYVEGAIGFSSITPYGIYGFNSQWLHYRVGAVSYPLNPTGNVFTWSATGQQLLYASESSRLALNESFNHVGNVVKVYQSVLPGGYPLTVQHYNYISLGGSWNQSYQVANLGGSYTTSLTYSQGISAEHGTLSNTTPGAPASRFHFFDANISVLQTLPQGFHLSLTASGQGAFNTLPQQNQWVLGGFGSLSAYSPGVLSGDSGYSARLQVQSPNWGYKGFQLDSNLFAEWGGVTTTYLAPGATPWRSLSDVGVGVTLQSPWGTSISAISALPVGWNHVSSADRRSSRMDAYFVLTQNF